MAKQRAVELCSGGATIKEMGQVTFELRGKPILIARAEWTCDPAEIVFIDRAALPGVEIENGMSLFKLTARVTGFANDLGEKLVRKVEGVIHPVYV